MAVKFVVNFCAVCGLILLSSSSISGVELTSEMVKQWAKRIGISGSNYIDRITGANDAKQAYENASFSTDLKDLDWREVLKQMKKDMEIFFSRKTRSLKKLVDRAEDDFCEYKYSKNLKISDIDYPNAKDLDQYLNKTGVRLAYDSSFQTEISFNRSVVHVPTDVFDGAAEIVNGISWTSGLDEIFNANRHDDPTLSWQYFGSDKGFMRTYPARRWDSSPSQVDLFDARQRPWYIQGATSPKNVIILIDASGSMHGVPMRIAKLAAQSLIDSFGDNDFFNVVHFNVTAAVLCCQETGPTLLQATEKNKIYVKNKLQQIEDGDVAVWKKGMDKAFELLRKADNCSHCQQAIMVLSDGTTSSLSDFFEENNPDKRVRVFTFAVGPPAESTQALQSMACKNRGYFSRLQSVGAVREVGEDYIRVLTRPMAMAPKANTTDHAVWTTVYRDALGLGMIITATLPVFHRMQGSSNCSSKDGMKDEERTKDHFLGVMGTDVPLHYLQNLILHPLVGPGGYMFAIDNNGMVMFHPRLKTVYGYLQDPPGVDLVDVESTESTQNDSKIEELRKAMIDTIRVTEQPYGRGPGSQTFEVYELSVDELRVKKQTMNYYYDGLEGTPFSIAMATPQLGYKYTTGMTLEKVISELYNQLLKEDKQNIAVERWPYCNNTVMSDSSPLDQLIEETKARDKSLCTNSDLLNGLLGDVTATSNISKLRNFPKSVDAIGIKQIFLRSFWGLTRSVSRDKSSTASQGDYFGRVFGSQIPHDSIVYTSPYKSAKSDKNTTSVFAYKRVFNHHRPAAVLGYESEMDFFVDNILVNNTECDKRDSRECDISCDRTGKNEYEGVYCYLLDENGFVVAGNDKSSAGRFFGRVDAPVMEKLIRSDESSGPGVYNKVVLTDFQGVCEEKNGVNSRGTSFLLKPLFSLSAYTEWWTSKAVWSLLYFNLYSWIFAGSGEATASEDVPKNVSCIKNVTTYYSTQENISENGTTTCDGCARSHFIANVRKSNLYLVVVNGTCGKCSQSVERMGIPGEPTRIDRKDVSDACKEPAYRKRPKRCFVSTNPETGYTCGVGSLTGPSLRQVIAVQFWVILLTWTASDFL
ncbi:voltage-dependent calcium channel subunit alpha-2/delta-1-like isoform X2 [Montipora foliosa]|uniref:voltage-dependent calcium channel subunit alpha-2/delta-1-like isoform X2 n=1 Tax=Montipora foliosa TaxID=591990 RepID=UPI0035F1EA6B